MKQCDGQISLFDIIEQPREEMPLPLPCETCGYDAQSCCDYPCTPDDYCVLGDKWIEKQPQGIAEEIATKSEDNPICQFSGHTCNKESVWEVADTLDDKADCPHTCCRKCTVKGCGARCSGSEEPKLMPGDWVEEDLLGDRLTFEEITQEVGNLIIIDKSTQSHAWYKVVLVEKIITHGNDTRSLYYYDGVKQRGMIGEQYFEEGHYQYTAKAWRIKG